MLNILRLITDAVAVATLQYRPAAPAVPDRKPERKDRIPADPATDVCWPHVEMARSRL